MGSIYRIWTEEEEADLKDKWGAFSLSSIARRMGRSRKSIKSKAYRLGLGGVTLNADYITWNELLGFLGVQGKKSWITKRGFPIKKKKIDRDCLKVVYLDDFWKWAEANKEVIKFSKLEKNILGKEPAFVDECRKSDTPKKNIKVRWKKEEDDRLIFLTEVRRYSITDISKELDRTHHSIVNRIKLLGLETSKEKRMPWTEEERQQAYKEILKGFSVLELAKKLNRSENSVRMMLSNYFGGQSTCELRKRSVINDGSKRTSEKSN